MMPMIVYNITTKVRWDILESWLEWQLEEQIPAVLSTRLFDSYRFYRLLEQDEEEGPSFVLQYFTSSRERYQDFMTRFAPELQQTAREKWGDKYISFQTLMSLVEASC